MSASRTERLLNLLIALLETRQGRSREFLRENIPGYRESPSQEAFERMFERDKTDLRTMGIPVETVTEGGLFEGDLATARYRIPKEAYRLPELRFTPEEAAVLSLASRLWQQASLGSAAARALRKLETKGVLPEADIVLGVEPRIRPGEPAFEPLLAAVTGHREVTFGYLAARSTEEQQRRVQPWGLGSRYGQWYLVGLDLDRHARRMFRLSRITTAVGADQRKTFEPPADFDLRASLAELDSLAEPATSRLLLKPGTVQLLRDSTRPAPGPAPAGWDAVELDYADTEVLADELAAHGPHAVVLEPADLAAAVRRRLQGVLDASARPVPAYSFEESKPATRPRPAPEDRLRRLLDLVPYLVHNPGRSVDDVAREFGVSRSQLEKDLELVFVSGLPSYMPDQLMDARWDDGYIYLDNADELSEPVRFSVDEACALLVGLQALAGVPRLTDRTALESVTAKISLAAGEAGTAASAVQAGLGPGAAPELLETLHRAAADGQQLRLRYLVPHRDEITERVVDPWRLFSVNDAWYLEAWCHSAEAVRNFRLDRIKEAVPAGAKIARKPDGGSFPANLFTPGADDVEVTVQLDRRFLFVAGQYEAVRSTVLQDGTAVAVLRVGSTSWLPQFVARTGGGVRVLEPRAVADASAEWAAQALSLYADGNPRAGGQGH